MTTALAATTPIDQLPVTLTDEDIANLIDCAGYGISYWAATATHDAENQSYRIVELQEAAGTTPAVAKKLSYDDIRRAFSIRFEEGKLPDWQLREIQDDDLAFDSEVADMVIQQALFGKVFYG